MAYEELQGEINAWDGKYIKMASAGTESVLALSQYGVGIGTIAPAKKIDIAGDAIVRGDGWGSGEDAVVILGDSNHYIRSVFNGGVRIGTYGATDGIVLQQSTGNVGIGTTNPASKLAVSGGASIGANYADDTAPSNGLIVEGNTGIGTTSPNSKFHVEGSVGVKVVTKTSGYTAADEAVILVNTGDVTISLPQASTVTGRTYCIKKISLTGGVTIDAYGSEKIDGATTYTFTIQWESITIVCDGTAWYIIA